VIDVAGITMRPRATSSAQIPARFLRARRRSAFPR
jgi:hypothetical protein